MSEEEEKKKFSSSPSFDATITATEAAWSTDLAPANNAEAPKYNYNEKAAADMTARRRKRRRRRHSPPPPLMLQPLQQKLPGLRMDVAPTNNAKALENDDIDKEAAVVAAGATGS